MFLTLDSQSNRRIDENGFLHVTNCNITCEQVAPYYGDEIPNYDKLGLKADKIYNVYRPAEELKKEETIKSLNGIPIQFKHHEDFADNPAIETRIGATGTDAEFKAPYLCNSLHFLNKTAISRIQDGSMKELSLGYIYDPILEQGTFNGQSYDIKMSNIRCNHVALVEEGRAGRNVCVNDSMENLKKMDNKDIEKKEVELAQQIIDLHRPNEKGEVVDKDETTEDQELSFLDKLKSAGLDLSKLDHDDVLKIKQIDEKKEVVTDDEQDDDQEVAKTDGKKDEPKKVVEQEEQDDYITEDDQEEDDEAEIDDDENLTEDDELPISDELLEKITQIVNKRVNEIVDEKLDAIEDVKSDCGKLKAQTFDNAGDVYRYACKQVGINTTSLSNDACRSAYQGFKLGSSKGQKRSVLAQDKKTVYTNSTLNKLLSKIKTNY